MNRAKEIDIKNQMYYFFNNMLNKKHLHPNKVKMH